MFTHIIQPLQKLLSILWRCEKIEARKPQSKFRIFCFEQIDDDDQNMTSYIESKSYLVLYQASKYAPKQIGTLLFHIIYA